jgi:hypothetical protein
MPTPSTASAAYADGQTRVNKAIADLQVSLRHHERKQKRAKWDWGYPGDLGRVLTLIQEAAAGLTEKEG